MGRILRTIVAIVISILWISISAFLFLNMASYKIVCKKSTGNCILAKKTTLEKTYTKYKEIPIASIKNAVLKKFTNAQLYKGLFISKFALSTSICAIALAALVNIFILKSLRSRKKLQQISQKLAKCF